MRGLTEAEKAQWPAAILLLEPEALRLHLDANGRPVVSLIWSGLGENWGVVVGSAEMEIPKPEAPRTEVIGGRTFHEHSVPRLTIAPGAYVWHRVD